MSDVMPFYDLNPVGVIDQDKWDLKAPEVNLRFHELGLYTPLIDWDASPQATGAVTEVETELLEGDVDSNPIPLTANFIDADGLDSRFRKFSVERHGGKVQLHKSSNAFTMWQKSGGRDWRPLLQGLLGRNVVNKFESLAKGVWFKGSKDYWTYSGNATDFAGILAADHFELGMVNEWNLRLGNTGSPVIPGDAAQAKLAILPPGAVYDFQNSLATATGNEVSMWRDAVLYQNKLNYEIGTYKNIRFMEAPTNRYGINPNVLYNAGTIAKQFCVIEPIHMGDGSPDPNAETVDGVWYVGQKDVTHYVKLENFAAGDFEKNQVVTLHLKATNAFGVTGGVDPFDGRTIHRRVVKVDAGAKTLAFDRPISFNYTSAKAMKSVSGNADIQGYAYVTRGIHIGFSLVLGSRAGVKGKVLQPLEFYEPVPVDDFKSVWRYTYDAIVGHNIAEPNMFELYFFSVSIPKPGGVQ
jgi:hypothetical protein